MFPPLKVSGLSEMVAENQRRKDNLMNLIAAEMGDESGIRLVGDRGEEFFDLSKQPETWDLYLTYASSYKKKGDARAVSMMSSSEIFSDGNNSQLREMFDERVSRTQIDPEYHKH